MIPAHTHLFCPIRKILDIKFLVKIGPYQEVVYSGSEPYERIGDANYEHFLCLFVRVSIPT